MAVELPKIVAAPAPPTPDAPDAPPAVDDATSPFDATKPSVMVVQTSGGGFMVGHVEGTNLPAEAKANEQELASTLIAKLVSFGFTVASSTSMTVKGGPSGGELAFTLIRAAARPGGAVAADKADSLWLTRRQEDETTYSQAAEPKKAGLVA
jgi:hypothetical protein